MGLQQKDKTMRAKTHDGKKANSGRPFAAAIETYYECHDCGAEYDAPGRCAKCSGGRIVKASRWAQPALPKPVVAADPADAALVAGLLADNPFDTMAVRQRNQLAAQAAAKEGGAT